MPNLVVIGISRVGCLVLVAFLLISPRLNGLADYPEFRDHVCQTMRPAT
jgi:hypothetical protein